MVSQSKVFGPVPSRRLGKSIGINNIPPKVCTFACVYCQVGRTFEMTSERRDFYSPAEIIKEVEEKIQKSHDAGEPIDYLTIVPDGEPTLDINLGKLIDGLKPFGIPVAVITNSTLLSDAAVREELSRADYVSMKLDAANQQTLKRVNRPVKNIRFNRMIEGMMQFSKTFQGKLVTESMLVRDLNDTKESVEGIAEILKSFHPDTAYIATPTRPTAVSGISPSDERTLTAAYQMFSAQSLHTELLIGYEGDAFASSGNAKQDLLSITAVHPMLESAVRKLLKKTGDNFSLVDDLIRKGQIKRTKYQGGIFYSRVLRQVKNNQY